MGYFQTFLAHTHAAGHARRVVASMQAAREAGRFDLADAIARAALPAGTTITGGLVSGPVVPAPPRFLDTAPVGSGKSRAYRQRIAATPPGTRIALAVADHRLGGEAAESLAQDAPDKTVMVWRGEAQPDPLNPGERMCRRHEEVAAVRRAGGKRDDLCGSAKRGLCPFYSNCGYRRQLAGAGGADVVVFGGNAVLGDAVPSVLRRDPEVLDVVDPATGMTVAEAEVQQPHFDLVIVDEPVIGQLIHGLSLDEPERPFVSLRDLESGSLFDPPHGASQAEIAALAAAKSAAGAFVKGLAAARAGRVQGRITMGDVRGAFRGLQDWDIERRALDARKACLAAVVPLKDLKPEIVGSWAGYEGVYGARIRTNTLMLALARLFGAVASAFSGPRRGLPDHEATPTLVWAAVPDGGGGREPGINYRWIDPLHEHWASVPTLILDATAPVNPVALEKFWPGLVRADVPVPAFAPGAVHVRQVHDFSGSYTKLKAMVASGEVARLARFLEIQNARVGGGTGSFVKALAAVPKFLEAVLLEHWQGSPPRGLELAHFGALRGQDKWRDVSYIAVIGRPLPPTTAVEDQSALITGAVPVEVRDYARVDADYVMSNGEVRYRVEGRPVHPDAGAESLRFSACEAELVQAIGRARAIRRTAPGSLRIDVLSNVPVPGLVVDELVPLDAIMAAADGGPVMLAAARGVILEPGGRGFWALISGLTDGMSRDAARVAAARRSREHPLNSTPHIRGCSRERTLDLGSADAHGARAVSEGSANAALLAARARSLDPGSRERESAVSEGTSHASTGQPGIAPPTQSHLAQTLPTTSPAVRDMLAAPWVPVILRPAGGRYAVRAYVRGKNAAEVEATLAEASRLAGTAPPVIVATGHAPQPRLRKRTPRPQADAASPPPPPSCAHSGDQPADAPAPAPAPPRASPESAPAEAPEASTKETTMPEPEAPPTPPAPTPTPPPEERTITVTPDDLRRFGLEIGLSPTTIRKTLDRHRVVARRDGLDAMVKAVIPALIEQAARRRTASRDDVKAAIVKLTRAA